MDAFFLVPARRMADILQLVCCVMYLSCVCALNQVELTPMAIAAGRRLSDRLFGGMGDAKADYANVPVSPTQPWTCACTLSARTTRCSGRRALHPGFGHVCLL